MNTFLSKKTKRGQAAIEYMLLLGVVVAIVLVGFRLYLPRAKNSAGRFYNKSVVGIMGNASRCGDGYCDPNFEDFERCCADCSGCGFFIPPS